MKKTIIVLSILILICLNVCVQAQPEYWQREYQSEYTQGPSHFFSDITLTQNGNFFVAGQADVAGYSSFIALLNSYGSAVWKKVILTGYANRIRKIVMVDSESCIMAGESVDSLFVMRVDMNGNIIWKKRYLNAAMQVRNLIKVSDGNFIVCGKIAGSSERGFLAKIDLDGALLWSKFSPTSSFRKEYDNISEINNNLYIGGFQKSSSPDPIKYSITKTDLSGNIIADSLISLNDEFSGLKYIFDNNFIYLFGSKFYPGEFGGNFYYKFSNNLALIDSVKIQSENLYYEAFQSCDFYKNSGFVIVNRNLSNSNEIVSVIKIIDFNGNLKKVKSLIPLPNGSIADKFIYYKNNLIFGCGYSDYYDSHLDRAYCMKMDTLLNTSQTPVGIKYENEILNNFSLHQNYPNPFNPSTKISYSLKKSSAIELKLFDINGRMIKIIESGFKPAGSYETNFSAEGLSSGVYFFSLYSEGILKDTKKAVVLK